VKEAPLKATAEGLVPDGEGWFVVNAREAPWGAVEGLVRYGRFEGHARFTELGINIHVLEPGEPKYMYHREDVQEDFLVLAGECLLLIEGSGATSAAVGLRALPPVDRACLRRAR
jgi:uncharacterized cupin superfamily protein